MRTFPNNRGLPPRLLSTTRHLWVGDQSSSSASLVDICGYGGNPLDLADVNSPAVCNGWGAGGGRVLDGAEQLFSAEDGGGSNDFAEMLYAYVSTLISFRLGANFTTAGCLLSYGADTADYAYSWDVGIDANRNIVLRYGNGSAWVTNTFTTPALRAGRRYQIGLVRDTSANTVLLYVNGALVETKTSVTDPSVSSATLTWRAGCRLTTDPADFLDGEVYAIRVDCSGSAAPTIADFREDFRRAQQWTTYTSCHYRAKLADSNGTLQDLTTFLSNDWFKGATIGDDADQNMETTSLELYRDNGDLRLSRYHDNRANSPDDYPPNQGRTAYDTTGATDILAPNREMKVEFARVPLGATPNSNDWQCIYHGKTGATDWGDDIAKAECNDLGVDLMKGYVEHTVQFPTNGVDHSLKATIWDGGSGHGLLDYAAAQSWIASAPTLYEPTASGVNITTWKQERQPLLPTIVGLAEQIGWLCRYRWWDATGGFALQLYQPDRTRAYEDAYLTSEDYVAIPTFKDDVADVRTRCRVLFQSTSPGDPPTYSSEYGGWGENSEGNPGQYYVECSGGDVDGAFVETGKRQFCELAEGSAVNLNSYAQADKLASGVVLDLYQCTTLMVADLFDMPEVECEDTLYFAADNVHSTVDFRLAVYSRSLSISRDRCSTRITMRGKPSGGTKRWIAREIRTSGARAGVMVKDDLEIAQSSGTSRRAQFAVFEQAGLVSSAPSSGVSNKDFQSALCGVNYVPEGWKRLAGTWGTEISLVETNATRGKYCLKVLP